MAEAIRLQKLLSQAGIASRRAAEELMRAGRVRVDGVVVTEPGVRVDPEVAVVEVDGRRVRRAQPMWIALNKPAGYVTTRRDPHGRPTVYALLPPELGGLFHVGRLDRESEGLLLLTNEGDVAHRLLHPSHAVDREYVVEVEGEVDREAQRRLVEGIQLEDGTVRARRVRLEGRAPQGTTRLRVVLQEGKKREVRRMMAAIGHPVRRLVRVGYGPIRLGRLGVGEWRRLSEREVAALAEQVGVDRDRWKPKR